MDTLTQMHRLLHEHGWKSKMDMDDIETGRAPIMDWTHPDHADVDYKISTWKKKDTAWWGDPSENITSESIQELADWLEELARMKR